ncbi:hypothetical protein ACWN8P_02380 [Vagococcus salmoninarum]|uniref:SipW-cognate class signal peptide n=1 Tax=Vagococcus salmoninarum TaxID=2739 RepID=A0A429ZUC3_9ENTE|nr:hypothetical protein [Vagococcus salmoninarum]RST97289.1 hypothetical protein CBF35_03310 [Vagococcus salmoninarum]
MFKTKKKMVGIIGLGVVVMLGIASTYAFLSDQTALIANTFTVGKVGISLAEPAWELAGPEHKIVPGGTLEKDPTLTVKADSEESYVYLELDFSNDLAEFTAYYELDYHADWELIASTPQKKVFAYKETVATSKQGTTLPALFTTISFSEELTSETLSQLTAPQINVKGYAIQAQGIATALAGWQEVSK